LRLAAPKIGVTKPLHATNNQIQPPELIPSVHLIPGEVFESELPDD